MTAVNIQLAHCMSECICQVALYETYTGLRPLTQVTEAEADLSFRKWRKNKTGQSCVNTRTNMHAHLHTGTSHRRTVIMCARHKNSGVNAHQYKFIHYLQSGFTKIAKYYSSFQYLVQRYVIICSATFYTNLYQSSHVNVLF